MVVSLIFQLIIKRGFRKALKYKLKDAQKVQFLSVPT